MLKPSFKALRVYIRSLINDLSVYDATKAFSEPENYASIYITNIIPTSNHNILNDEYIEENTDQTEVKVFEYKESSYLSCRIDFRGDKAVENIALFKNSLIKDSKLELLKEAGLGYLGFSNYISIPTVRGAKAKNGMTITLKFFVTEIIKDESQLIKIFDIKVSKKIK